jgi:AcrR family transcriptional regulator
MIGTAVEMLGELGSDALSIREVARRAGVSSGAPFHHFPTRKALMTAVAEGASQHFRQAVEQAAAAIPETKPSRRLRAIARAGLRWVVANPAQYKVMSERAAIDDTQAMRSDNAAIQALMREALRRAIKGKVDLDLDLAVLEVHAMGYGLARMFVDGHLTGIAALEQMETAMEDMLARLTGRKSA